MTTAADIMTREVVTVTLETPVREIADLLASHRFGSVPVLDAAGVVHGIVTEEDLVERAVEIHLPRHIPFLGGVIFLENPAKFEEEAGKILALTAQQIMKTAVPSTAPDTPVEDLAYRMLEDDIRRVLVLDGNRRLLGIVTRADIIRMQIAGGQLPDQKAR